MSSYVIGYKFKQVVADIVAREYDREGWSDMIQTTIQQYSCLS